MNWLTLHSDTFLWVKGQVGLIYNTRNFKRLEFQLTDNIQVMCQNLLKLDSLYSVELLNEYLLDTSTYSWIQSIINIEAGYLTNNIPMEKRPVSLKPELKIQDDREYYLEQHEMGCRGKILQNLHELTFHINGSKYGDSQLYRQCIFPIKTDQKLSIEQILLFLKNSKSAYLSNVNWIGDPFNYPNFEQLLHKVTEEGITSTVNIHICDYLNNLDLVRKFPNSIKINIIVDRVFDISYLNMKRTSLSLIVLVHSIDEFQEYESVIGNVSFVEKVNYIPVFTGKNRDFFKDAVFLNQRDLDKIKLVKYEIFIHQALNTNFFGKLTILPNGNVYANPNEPLLGRIDETPYTIVYKEFSKGHSWFCVRINSPCDQCVYQWICPSPSSYEYLLEQANPCNLIENIKG